MSDKEHLEKKHISALNYHLEFGDILDSEEHLRITRHLDNCIICRKRYHTDDKGIVVDKKEALLEEVINKSRSIVIENLDNISKLEEFSFIEKIYNENLDFVDKMEELYNYGETPESISNKLIEQFLGGENED